MVAEGLSTVAPVPAAGLAGLAIATEGVTHVLRDPGLVHGQTSRIIVTGSDGSLASLWVEWACGWGPEVTQASSLPSR